MALKKRGLGRGLDALLGTGPSLSADEKPERQESELRHLPLDIIERGRYQPRKDMHPEALEDLAASIRAQGVVQPIVVRPNGAGRYEIIAGERRWRAAQLAGLDAIPAVVRDVPDESAVAMALIENIQREDLNAMEEAAAFQRLITEFEMTHQQVADAVGRSRTAVTNLLRLLSLQDEVKRLVEHGDLEMGHARALLALEGGAQTDAARTVVARGLSVRETEQLVRRLQAPAGPKRELKPDAQDPDIRRLQDQLSERLGAGVRLEHTGKGRGKLVIHYNSLDELDGILAHIQ